MARNESVMRQRAAPRQPQEGVGVCVAGGCGIRRGEGSQFKDADPRTTDLRGHQGREEAAVKKTDFYSQKA